jgi:HPr kinase/phosphorylase
MHRSKPIQPLVTVEQFYKQHSVDLGLSLIAGAVGLKRPIREPTVNRPGLALAGFKKYFAPKRVQVIGNVESAYLRSLSVDMRESRIGQLFSYRIPCAVVCRNLPVGKLIIQTAEKRNVPLFTTGLITMKFISLATFALENLFAPRGQLHGSMVDIRGIGVVIQGESGIGKSEAVLGLLERGHSLVADDVTLLRLEDGVDMIGTAKDIGRNLMEVRGIGIIDVAATFGVGAIRREKRVDLVITLKLWAPNQEVDRLGIEQETVEILGQKIPHMTIQVRPGRDLGNLVEVAALQTKLKLSGYNAAQEFSTRLMAQMKRTL